MKSFIHEIMAVVVLYNQDYKFSVTLNSLNRAVISFNKKEKLNVFIYDNSPVEQNRTNKFDNLIFHYVSDPTNPGVSKAYNDGAKYAKTQNKLWLLLLDQDTNIAPNAFLEYYRLSTKDKVNLYVPILKTNAKENILSPFKVRFNRGYSLKQIKPGRYLLNKYHVINSGIFVDTNSYEQCGGHNEKVFLDYSDYEFIRRFSKTNKYFIVTNSIWNQEFSSNVYDQKGEYERFVLFVNSIAAIKKNTVYDKTTYFGLLLIRGLKLSLKYKRLSFIRLILNEYF